MKLALLGVWAVLIFPMFLLAWGVLHVSKWANYGAARVCRTCLAVYPRSA